MKKFIIVFMILSIVGCAKMPRRDDFTFHEQPCIEVPTEGKGLVYFFREKMFTGSGISYFIHDGNTVIGGIRSGSYFPYQAEPGEHSFWAETEDKAFVTIEIEEGETYYINCGVSLGMLAGRPEMTKVVEDVALPIIHESECAIVNPAAAME